MSFDMECPLYIGLLKTTLTSFAQIENVLKTLHERRSVVFIQNLCNFRAVYSIKFLGRSFMEYPVSLTNSNHILYLPLYKCKIKRLKRQV